MLFNKMTSRPMEADWSDKLFLNKKPLASLSEHRRKFIGLREFDYNSLQPDKLNILPPTPEIEQLWKEDYRRMRDTMIYGESVELDELIKMMRVLMGICNEN